MNIRSLTVGAALPSDAEARGALVARLGEFAVGARGSLEAAGFTVQTSRLSAQPLERWIGPVGSAVEQAATLAAQCTASGLDYCSLGTLQAAAPGEAARLAPLVNALPEILLAGANLFGSVQVGFRRGGPGIVSHEAVAASARVIAALAHATPDGFGNLRFAAAANCPPHVPFYPASYYEEDERNGGEPEFGLALEAAGLAVSAFEAARTLDEARSNLLALLADEGGKAAQVCAEMAADSGYTFTGLDISMAPYPTPELSVARSLEMLLGGPLGSPGTLAAAAALTDMLRAARDLVPTVGYSGLMLPVLEDQTLADRAAEGSVTLDTLLLMSAVCGLGLDTIPLPGDISLEQVERIVLDMAALAVRLDKPLTARLLPVPGRAAGDPAEWPDFPYFARGRVMRVAGDRGSGDAGGLLGSAPLTLGG